MLLAVLVTVVFGDPPKAHAARDPEPPMELDRHLKGIATFSQSAPMVDISAGWFFMGTNRVDDDPFGFETQFDDTEFPQRRIWLDTYAIDRYEVTLAEYLSFLHQQGRPVSTEITTFNLASDQRAFHP